jgi:hypothetical protein
MFPVPWHALQSGLMVRRRLWRARTTVRSIGSEFFQNTLGYVSRFIHLKDGSKLVASVTPAGLLLCVRQCHGDGYRRLGPVTPGP